MTDTRDDIDLDDIRRRLDAELETLRSMSIAASDQRQPVELDQQSVGRLSRMDAMQVQAMAQAVDGRRRGRQQQVAAALKRLDDGDYGFCVACGEPIAAKRLAIDLTAARCIGCAR